MKKHSQLLLSAVATLAIFAGAQLRADDMASIAIDPVTGAVTVAPRWTIGGSLAGFHYMAQDLSLGGGPSQFYSIKGTTIPSGGDITAFMHYIPSSGASAAHADIGSKLTPDSYSALTSADPDVGYGPINFYLIHHKSSGDYFTTIVPSSGTASAVTDLKPMSGPGGPATLGGSGYFGLTFAAVNLGYGLDYFYYLRTDQVSGFTKFGILDPALLGTSTDEFDLGVAGFNALEYAGPDLGFGPNKMFYLRLDPVTGYTILGTLHPLTGQTADIANLGSVYSTLTFVPGDLTYGADDFYTSGTVNTSRQSVSFAAIAGRAITAGPFTVSPSASSGLPITLTVVTGSATISAPSAGVFTVTPTAPGLITLQAAQAGQISPTAFEYNMLRQSFTVTIDFNSDGMTDLLWQNSATGERYVWLMAGPYFSSGLSLGTVPTAWQVAGTSDFNGDGKLDILWENTTTGDVYVWLMNGTTFASSVYIGTVPTQWTIAGTGDFNGDGKTDLIWENSLNGDRVIWMMNGTSYFNSVDLGIVDPVWHIAAVGDFNSDGKPDLVWQNTSTGECYIWMMNGTTFTSSEFLGVISTDWKIAEAADYNQDGKTDLLWQNTTTGERDIWLMNGTVFNSAVPLGTVSTQWQLVK
jgi:hypothetical protein